MTADAFPSVSICVPAFNEEATVEAGLRQIEKVADELGCSHEIIICDDASTDRTGNILRKLVDDRPHWRLITHEKNRGIRATFEELYAAARMELVFLIPSDLEWPADTLGRLLPLMKDSDMVIAARIDKHYGFRRAFVSAVFNLIARLLFGVPTSDAGAVKLVRRELMQIKIISKSPFSEAERIIRAVRAGYRLQIVRVETQRRPAGTSHGVRLKVLVLAVADVIRVWLDLHAKTARESP
jgi:glycosyltransferase involved in cell wall biosynthesis